ncbi:hypothetical protein SDC9_187085 [bioreactor metagenome]|uniref:Uncharacterized protein n=1 Tax=bioreactor metagenome TaxID=1076179 RepID=A0A645HKP5_9ZZZZ
MGRVVHRHLGGHVADDALHHNQRDSGDPGEVTERMPQAVYVFDGNSPTSALDLLGGLDSDSFKKRLDAIRNAGLVLAVHLRVFR